MPRKHTSYKAAWMKTLNQTPKRQKCRAHHFLRRAKQNMHFSWHEKNEAEWGQEAV